MHPLPASGKVGVYTEGNDEKACSLGAMFLIDWCISTAVALRAYSQGARFPPRVSMVIWDTSRHRRLHIAFLALLVLLLISPQTVETRSYSLDRVVVNARVDRGGSLWIDEIRTYTFDGRYSWADFRLPLDRIGTVSEFSLFEGDRPFARAMDEEPGTYQLESSEDEFYVRWYHASEDETRSFRLRYRISNAVTSHSDVAELYFQFVGEINPQFIGSVEVELALPEAAEFGEVLAWAHGPLHGRVDFQDSGRLSLNVSPLPARQMWEARITFPPDWVEADPSTVSGEGALDRILAEEDAWTRDANARRERDQATARERVENNRIALQASGVLAGLGLLTVLLGYLKVGRTHQVPYGQTIDSTLPDETPALVSYFYHGKNVLGAALGATLIDLARKGVISLEQDPEKKKWYESGSNFTIRLEIAERSSRQEDLEPYENSLIEFLFDKVAKGSDSLHSRQLRKAGGEMRSWFEKWKKLVQTAAGDQPYYDRASKQATIVSALVAGGIVLAGIVLMVAFGVRGLVAVVAGVACLGLSFAILRLTPEMQLKRNKLVALRGYLKKYHQHTGTGVGHQIGEYLVYGLALGLDSKSIEGLFGSLSEEHRATYLPWYVDNQGAASPAEFAQAMTSVVTAATATVSSSAGAGGGASGGGGDGGGGGGGGAG